MPVIIALAVRALIQIGVTLGLITLAEKFVFPLINRGIQELIELFGVSEEDAEDIVANEILIFVESVGVGALALRSRIPLKIAERLRFTSKGFKRRKLSPKAKQAVQAPPKTAGAPPVIAKTPSPAEANKIITAAKRTMPGFNKAMIFLGATLHLGFLAALVIAQWIDFGNWETGAYSNTFQRIYRKITGGLLQPNEDYRKTKTTSPEVFNKVYNTYKLEGAVGISDPFKAQSVLFTRDNLIDLLDHIGAQLLLSSGRASTKDAILATQLMIVFSQQALQAPPATAPTVPTAVRPVKVFTGLVAQGTLGAQTPFVPREDDLITSIEDVRLAAQNNLATFLATLFGRIIYEIKIVSRVINKDGTRRIGATQRVVSSYTKDGEPRYKTVTNKFAVMDIFVFTSRNVRSKIDTIVLGPTDAATFRPSQQELVVIENDLRQNLVTRDIKEITAIETDSPVVITPLLPPEAEAEPVVFPPFAGERVPTWEEYRTNPNVQEFVNTISGRGEGGTGVKLSENFFRINMENDYGIWRRARAREAERAAARAGVQGEVFFGAGGGVSGGVEIPPSNNPNRCAAFTIAEFFDIARITYPDIEARGKLYEAFDLGPANWYTGTADQNIKLLTELKRRSGC